MKKFKLVLPFILVFGSMFKFYMDGSYMDSRSILMESFYLLPVSYFFLGLGIIQLIREGFKIKE